MSNNWWERLILMSVILRVNNRRCTVFTVPEEIGHLAPLFFFFGGWLRAKCPWHSRIIWHFLTTIICVISTVSTSLCGTKPDKCTHLLDKGIVGCGAHPGQYCSFSSRWVINSCQYIFFNLFLNRVKTVRFVSELPEIGEKIGSARKIQWKFDCSLLVERANKQPLWFALETRKTWPS